MEQNEINRIAEFLDSIRERRGVMLTDIVLGADVQKDKIELRIIGTLSAKSLAWIDPEKEKQANEQAFRAAGIDPSIEGEGAVNGLGLDGLIAMLARYAAAADTGALIAEDESKAGIHSASAKAYRHAISLVIKHQRRNRRSALESEQ